MEELNEKLLLVLSKALEMAEKTGEFAVEQAPLLLQEFYQWHFWENVFFIVLFSILFGVVIKIGKITQKSLDAKYMWSEPGPFFTYAIGGLFTCIPALYHIYNLVFLTVAPKLYLIEYLIKLKG